MTAYDIITLGETMIRFTPPDYERIEQATTVQLFIGGTESNTAVGLARLGMNVAWISRLTDNPMGRYIANGIRAHGVDTSHVIWTVNDRIGLYFLEEGVAPRGSRVFYDRAGSAMSKMLPDELPTELFRADGSKLLHFTGITLAISESAKETALRALALAKQAGWLVSFDVNYRARLWTPQQARQICDPIMKQADILLIPLGDAKLLYDLPDDITPEAALEQLHGLYPQARLVLTLGADGAIACDPDGTSYYQPAFPAEEVCRVGGGDAFCAGFLYAYLRYPDGDRLANALRYGTAAAAIKYSLPGDIPFIERAEVEALANSTSGDNQPRLVR